jgi:hypothetical protein
MAVYRCLLSGQTVEFTLPHDIESMKGHAGYERIDQVEEANKDEQPTIRFKPVVKTTRQSKKSVS